MILTNHLRNRERSFDSSIKQQEKLTVSALDYMSLTLEQQFGGVLPYVCGHRDLMSCIKIMGNLKNKIMPYKNVQETIEDMCVWFDSCRTIQQKTETKYKEFTTYLKRRKIEKRQKIMIKQKHKENKQNPFYLEDYDLDNDDADYLWDRYKLDSLQLERIVQFVIHLIYMRYNYSAAYIIAGSRVPDIYITLTEMIPEVIATFEAAILKFYAHYDKYQGGDQILTIYQIIMEDNECLRNLIKNGTMAKDLLAKEQMYQIKMEIDNIRVTRRTTTDNYEMEQNLAYSDAIFDSYNTYNQDLFMAIRDVSYTKLTRHEITRALKIIFAARQANLIRRYNTEMFILKEGHFSVRVRSKGLYTAGITTVGRLKITTYSRSLELMDDNEDNRMMILKMADRKDQVGILATSVILNNWSKFSQYVNTANATYLPDCSSGSHLMKPRMLDDLVLIGFTCHFSTDTVYIAPPRYELIGDDYIQLKHKIGNHWTAVTQCQIAHVGYKWDHTMRVSGMAEDDFLQNVWLDWYVTGDINLSDVSQESLIINYDKIIVLKNLYIARSPWVQDILDAVLTVCNHHDDQNLAFAIMVRAAIMTLPIENVKEIKEIEEKYSEYIVVDHDCWLVKSSNKSKEWYCHRINRRIFRIKPSVNIRL